MKKLQKLLALGLAAAGAAVLLTGCGKKALEDSDLEAASWDQITEAARDTTVTFYGWGGDENRNNWLNTTVADHVKENYGITLEVVGMDINDILTKLSGEKQAGSEKGSIDMIWINGENFTPPRITACYTAPLPISSPIWRPTSIWRIQRP